MAVTLVVDVPLAGHVRAQLSPLAELAGALHAVREPEHHPLSQDWVTRFSGFGDGRLRQEAYRWDPLWGAFKARYFSPLVVEHTAEIHHEIEMIATLDLREFVAVTAQALIRQNAFVLRDLADFERWDRDDFLRRIQGMSEAHTALARDLFDDPAAVRTELISFLHSVAAGPFAREWELGSGHLEYARTRTLSDLRDDPWAVFEQMTMTRVDRDAGLLVFEKFYNARLALSAAPVLIVPTLHTGPHRPVKHYPGYPVVVHVPIGAGTTERSDGMTAVMERLAALNEPTRLGICRDLIRMPASTTELARRHLMSVPQVSRHLRRLREVGLVVGEREGAVVRYHLELDTLRRMGTDVIGVLRA